jgi:hypothetical protein
MGRGNEAPDSVPRSSFDQDRILVRQVKIVWHRRDAVVVDPESSLSRQPGSTGAPLRLPRGALLRKSAQTPIF